MFEWHPRGQDRLETLAAEERIEQTALPRVIIDNQDTGRFSRIGMKLGRHCLNGHQNQHLTGSLIIRTGPVKEDYKPDSAQGRLFAFQKPARMYCGSHVLPLVIIDDLDIERIAFAELKADTPAVVDRHGPLFFPCALQFVQSNAPQWTEILKTFGDVQCQQQIRCRIDVKAAELV